MGGLGSGYAGTDANGVTWAWVAGKGIFHASIFEVWALICGRFLVPLGIEPYTAWSAAARVAVQQQSYPV
jgi:hypothetical protein